jgi:hypothetical protein
MVVTVTLPDELVKNLQTKATRQQLSLDQLVIGLLTTALKTETEFEPALDEVVAKIQATPPNPLSIRPATGSLAEALQTGPTDPDFDLETWRKQWAAIEAEMKTVTRLNDIAEVHG